MAADEYTDTLNEMISLFKNYKPGKVTLDNITKLCQTLGLESFIDDVDNETGRLSTASKIIVIDIDFMKNDGSVKDVKLVLASNFDNFNYFENKDIHDINTNGNKENNILLRCLIDCSNLNKFHENLKFLYLLDTYSQLDADSGNSTHGSNGLHANRSDSNAMNVSSGNMGSNNSSMNSGTGVTNTNGTSTADNQMEKNKLDLFKYFTELSQYIQDYFNDIAVEWTIATNLDNKFGIYIVTNSGSEKPEVIAKIIFQRSKDPQYRLYEYIYSKDTKEWINESAESYTTGVTLVMEIMSGSTWFPKIFISNDVIFDNSSQLTNFVPKSNTNMESNDVQTPSELLKLLTNVDDSNHKTNSNGLYYHDKIQFINDFTSPLIKLPYFDISNDNVDVIHEILTWTNWSKNVLESTVELMIQDESSSNVTDNKLEVGKDTNANNTTVGFNSINQYRTNSIAIGKNMMPNSTAARRRRSSNKGKRPSITESTIFKDEGLQQFNLNEVMSEQPIITEDDEESAENHDHGETQPMVMSHDNDMNTGINFNGDLPDTSKDALTMVDDSRMDIDPMELGNDIEVSEHQQQDGTNTTGKLVQSPQHSMIQLIISEDHISLGDIASCNLYETPDKWQVFMKALKNAM
ncbi:Mediator of RNA polymerase II transcription subunit 1 [Maudiozyma exigua]|uniref:Mediator of RNA polymerase II transcription subunit 1 n=1 Tax=Maudiozyma exigua TaxID=34358 RepID=A0A9P7B9S2_MAUEX|nr:Mediator of RNA polymerase II transcription subunit 1 [Kazachstania exigua]